MPRTFETHLWLSLYGIYENDQLQSVPRHFTWSDLFLREKLTLQTSGYFYHPRFLRYRLQLSGGLDQEQYRNSTAPPLGTRHGNAFEYDARLLFLPEHPYNLELFATRTEPLFREENAIEHTALSTSYGADLRYRQRPWLFHARVSDEGIDSAGVSTDVKQLVLDGKYYKDFGDGKLVSFDARYNPVRTLTSDGFRSDTDNAFFGNTLGAGRFRLYSNVNLGDLTQQGGAATLQADSRLLSWYEQLTGDLPWNFRLELFWRYFDSQSTYGNQLDPAGTTLTSVIRDAEATLRHSLYESLQSYYTFRWNSGESSGGTSTSLTNFLSFNYTKRIDDVRGRLDLGLNLGKGDVRNTGQTQVVDEPHPGVAVPGTIRLLQPGADPQSVLVLVRSPAPPYDLVRLIEGVHYTVATVGNSLEITVVTLPPEFAVPGRFDFRVSYSLLAGNYEATTKTFGQNGSLALFDNLVTPYYSYSSVRWTTVSGTAPGGGLNSDVFIAGVSFLKGPLRGRFEYSDVSWATSPWRGWRAEAQYLGPVGLNTNVNVTAYFQDRQFADTTATGGIPAYSEKQTAVFGNVQQFLMERQMTASVGGSFTRIQGLSDSRTWAFNATLSLHVGKLDIVGGANYSSSESQNGTSYASQTTHQYYYLWLRRLIF